MAPLFEVDNLRLHYRTRFGDKIHAVDGVSFSLEKGQVLGIAGESGCGKSTLVNGSMALFLPPLYHTSGDIRIKGDSIVGLEPEQLRTDVLGKRISMIPQGALNALNPTRKVRDFAADVMLSHYPKMDKKEIYDRLHERFEQIGLDAKRVLGSYPVELSGGMKQRVVIGISTLMNPEVVIADEPTSALDVSTQRAVIEMIFDLMDKEIIQSMIFITHELPLLKHVSSHIAIMYAGEFVEYGTTDQVLFDSQHPYTKALMDSMLLAEEGADDQKPVALTGAPPNLQFPPPGCRFAERCPSARPECKDKVQQIEIIKDREVRCEYAK
jgi:peptide/nickel transport system ATP-binding protein